jgi:hypothetical protein
MLWSHRRWFAVGFLVFGAIMYTAVLFTPLSKPYMTGVERIFLTLHRDRAWWLADGTPQPTALTRPATIDFAVFFFTCVVIVSLLAGALGGGAVCLFLRSWGRDERPVSLNQAFGGASALHGEPAEGLET